MKKIWEAVTGYFQRVIVPMFTNIEWKKVQVSTYVRWVLAIIVSLNTVLTFLGVNPIPFSETMVYEIVSICLNVIILIVNTYKNNSTSKEAIITDQILRALKAAAQSDEDTAIGRIQDILKELNGDDYVGEDHSKLDAPQDTDSADANE